MAKQNASISAEHSMAAQIIFESAKNMREDYDFPSLRKHLNRAHTWYAASTLYANLEDDERQHAAEYHLAVMDLIDTIARQIEDPHNPNNV
ncbi:hypothetical protein [Siphonobacter sp. SORGH_AS_0500]|uniref:hypothetical protein n=1 Tax=Siphonobacter sp. SORGH_AS_0500 TaxID=1864824 RepID=UPI000CB8A06B|nr:hypothetical protein [Siphonobacter sp. SORGH_AS_0500]MDR6193669.1 hypothetical protein [Siphonobacter sp. SORGH_AS_0500]PKK36545.1 hypothetical protein BWI96_11870 [Siphonobacter sp. SORGH_AS_0500]